MITQEEYFGPYADHPEATDEMRANADDLLPKVNGVLAAAQSDGVTLHVNPKTGSNVAGEGNGGFRPQATATGAAHSKHKTAQAVDVYDPHRELASWAWKNQAILEAAGLHIERPEWTPSWVHMQDVAPASGVFAFIPSSDPPLASKLPEQMVA
jgi:hypothetical protein